MSYSIYKNKKLLKELSDKDYRLLKFNSKLINPFHTYLMYSLVPSELNELSFKDLNYVVEIFKKKINKFVKKKFNKNYVNANAQKDLDIFAELCHLNISIFNNNFDNLHSSTKNKKYTKRLYLINRDNDLFLLIKKDKKGLKLKLGNNILKPIQSGGGEISKSRLKQLINKLSQQVQISLSGEFFDLTITSTNNEFGKKKNRNDYGISIPIDKYAEELQMILSKDEDDKSKKRWSRLALLMWANGQEGLANLFQRLTTYLNGGTDFDGVNTSLNFRQNPLHIVVAGGNIIKIFGCILYKIWKKMECPELSFLKMNVDYQNIHELLVSSLSAEGISIEGIINMVIVLPDSNRLELQEFNLNDYNPYTLSYSDFDYNLVPNNLVNLQQDKEINDGDAGFVLIRGKSFIPKKGTSTPFLSHSEYSEYCKPLREFEPLQQRVDDEQEKFKEELMAKFSNTPEDKINDVVDLFFNKKQVYDEDGEIPQLMTEGKLKEALELLENVPLNQVTKANLCYHHYLSLLKRKNKIGMETDINILATIDYMISKRWSDKLGLEELPNEDNKQLYHNIACMKYLNMITEYLNTFLGSHYNLLTYDFSSLDTIFNTQLASVGSHLLERFLDHPTTQPIIDHMLMKRGLGDINKSNIRYFVVPKKPDESEHYNTMKKYKDDLKSMVSGKENISVIYNYIITDNKKTLDEKRKLFMAMEKIKDDYLSNEEDIDTFNNKRILCDVYYEDLDLCKQNNLQHPRDKNEQFQQKRKISRVIPNPSSNGYIPEK